MCGDCGRLGWPTSRAAASHRQEESTALARQPPCSHCGERSWIDLGLESAALALREDEESRAEARRQGLRPVIRRAAGGAFVGSILGLSFIGAAWGVALVAALGGVVAGLGTYQNMQLAQGPDTRLPARWAMALPPAGRAGETRRGELRLVGEPLRAPLTGRPCAAWELGARYDDDPTAAPRTWALLEQKIAPLEVEGQAVAASSTHLQLTRERQGSSSTLELDPAAQVFLEQRGLALDGMVLELYETIVEVDAVVEVSAADEGATLRVVGARA